MEITGLILQINMKPGGRVFGEGDFLLVFIGVIAGSGFVLFCFVFGAFLGIC